MSGVECNNSKEFITIADLLQNKYSFSKYYNNFRCLKPPKSKGKKKKRLYHLPADFN